MEQDLVILRAKYLQEVRDFFLSRDFTECITPKLVINPGLEPNIVPFESELSTTDMGTISPQNLYLATSPEYHLKKILASGIPNIFEIAACYRNGEIGKEHQYEFLMLEWYRCPGTYKDIAQDFKSLLKSLGKVFSPCASWSLSTDLNVTDAFREFLNIDLDLALVEKKFTLPDNLAGKYSKLDFEDMFYTLLSNHIQPQLGMNGPCFLWDFPFFGGGLCRQHPERENFVERFEVYWQGQELANAFGEITDAERQQKLCEYDRNLRIKRYGNSPPIDEQFINAIDSIESPAGGIAVGLDRLLMALTQSENISEVVLFPNT